MFDLLMIYFETQAYVMYKTNTPIIFKKTGHDQATTYLRLS